jgi:hypothetical protein
MPQPPGLFEEVFVSMASPLDIMWKKRDLARLEKRSPRRS